LFVCFLGERERERPREDLVKKAKEFNCPYAEEVKRERERERVNKREREKVC
jgi:hypothetical protein